MSDKEQMSGNTDLENAPTGFYSSHEEGAPEAVEDERPSHDSLGKIYTGGDDNEYIYIGRQKFLKSDLFEAFGGTLNPGLAPPSVHKFANPASPGSFGVRFDYVCAIHVQRKSSRYHWFPTLSLVLPCFTVV